MILGPSSVKQSFQLSCTDINPLFSTGKPETTVGLAGRGSKRLVLNAHLHKLYIHLTDSICCCLYLGVHDYLTNFTDKIAEENDLILMIDGYDIWFQLSPRTLIERFEELGTSQVVIGVEVDCWPNDHSSVSLADSRLPLC